MLYLGLDTRMFKFVGAFLDALWNTKTVRVRLEPSESLPSECIVDSIVFAEGKSHKKAFEELKLHVYETLESRLDRTPRGEQALAYQCVRIGLMPNSTESIRVEDFEKLFDSAMQNSRELVLFHALDTELVSYNPID